HFKAFVNHKIILQENRPLHSPFLQYRNLQTTKSANVINELGIVHEGLFCNAKIASKTLKSLAHPKGFEPLASAFGGQRRLIAAVRSRPSHFKTG
ncbi:MAG: hypothetical protein K8F90_20605, partial [Hyphomicrobiales bacterium]|nr:hypothetical protein [Hyphomicrobiales bacterium]